MNRNLIQKRGVEILAIIGSFFIVDAVLGWGSKPEPTQQNEVKQEPAAPVWHVIGGSRGWKGVPQQIQPRVHQPARQTEPKFNREIDQGGGGYNPWAVKKNPVERPSQPKQSRPWGGLPEATQKPDWRDEKRQERYVGDARERQREPQREFQSYTPYQQNRGYAGRTPSYGYGYPYQGNGWESGNPFSNGSWSPWGGNNFPFSFGSNNFPFFD